VNHERTDGAVKCLVCDTGCGIRSRPMSYLFRRSPDGRRDDIRPFCSARCVRTYVDGHPAETAAVPRCAVCGAMIVNAPWYASLADSRPRHYECTPGADQQDFPD